VSSSPGFGQLPPLHSPKELLHLAPQAVGQRKALIAGAGKHLAGGLLRKRLHAALADLIRKVHPAFRACGKFFWAAAASSRNFPCN